MPPRRKHAPLIGRRRRTANMASPRPARFVKRRFLKNKKKLRRIARRVNTGTAVHGNSRILIGTFVPTVNVNHPAAPDLACTYEVINVLPARIEELTARTVIYSKFRIRSVKYTIVRDNNPSTSQQLATFGFAGGANTSAFGYMFPNTFNRLLPTTTGSNANGILTWAMQQTGVKRYTVMANKVTKKVSPKLTINDEYQGPSGLAAGSSVIVNRNVMCPWLDLNNDLLDNISLAQLVVVQPAIDVVTTNVLSTGAAAGLNLDDVREMFRWRIYADVGYSVKGRWLDKAVA